MDTEIRTTSARDAFVREVAEPSDIQAHLPHLRRAAHGEVLELGVRGGRSTVALLAGLEERGGRLWSVDVDSECGRIFPNHAQWRFVCADSCDVAALDAAGLPAAIDILFVDTIHTYERVRDELRAWGDRVRPGGGILFHDTDSYPEIRPAIAEWCHARSIPYEFRRGSNGLGIAYPGRGRAFAMLVASRQAIRRARILIGAAPGARRLRRAVLP